MGGRFNQRNTPKPPLARLERCHRRLEERLRELVQAAETINASSERSSAWTTVEEVHDYLRRATLRHEQDEEESVFPRLASHAALRPFLDRLRGDHAIQRKLIGRFSKLLSGTRSAVALLTLARELQENYLDHIDREDRELLPAIQRHIDAKDQALMAQEMAARRSDS